MIYTFESLTIHKFNPIQIIKNKQPIRISTLIFNFTILLILLLPVFLTDSFAIISSSFLVNTFIPKYQESILPIQIMSTAIIPLTISAIYSSEFLGKENSRIVLIGSIIQFSVYFVLILILGGEYGLIGLAFGFLIAVSLKTIFNYYINKTQKGLKS